MNDALKAEKSEPIVSQPPTHSATTAHMVEARLLWMCWRSDIRMDRSVPLLRNVCTVKLPFTR